MFINSFTIISPLEQFLIIPEFKLSFFFFDIHISNQTIFYILGFLFLLFLLNSFNKTNSFEQFSFANNSDISFKNLFSFILNDFRSFNIKEILSFSFFNKSWHINLFIIPNNVQILIEIIYKGVLSMINENIKSKKAEAFLPIVFTTFLFLLDMNLIGLIPYSFTVTSHLIVTLTISLILFIGLNIICIRIHNIKFFALFLPANTGIELAFLLVPIETISYIFKPVSLSIRLFANMMAGHTLLKVIAGFGWTLVKNTTGIVFLLHLVPLAILIPLFVLETGVAMIQAFVFTILLCIYLNDAVNLH